MTASAQYPVDRDRPYQEERESGLHARVFERVRIDLDHAGTFAAPFTGDEHRLVRAREEVTECQHAVASGEYDRATFGEALTAIQRVVDLNRLSDRSRSLLVDDLASLCDLQARWEG